MNTETTNYYEYTEADLDMKDVANFAKAVLIGIGTGVITNIVKEFLLEAGVDVAVSSLTDDISNAISDTTSNLLYKLI